MMSSWSKASLYRVDSLALVSDNELRKKLINVIKVKLLILNELYQIKEIIKRMLNIM